MRLESLYLHEAYNMSLPTNIRREHILNAIKKIDIEGIPPQAHSSTYDVDFNGKKYPPKLVVSYANIYANGDKLDRKTFDGGLNTECFEMLEENGFTIVKKDSSFWEILRNFLRQAQSSDLKTKSYPKSFNDLSVQVSFGQGNQARVPWIAFLREGQAVSNGIYPVFLYYRHENLLVLAYGLSDTKEPKFKWNLGSETKTIDSLFKERFQNKPDRYGESYVYSYYSIDSNSFDFGLSKAEIDNDLLTLINLYKELPLETSKRQLNFVSESKSILNKAFDFKIFKTHTEIARLSFSEKLIIRFISSLCTKPFVILTGLSGSGKTKLAQAFAHWISEDANQICIVPVGADWTNREPLLGYPNALEPERYAVPENGALKLLIEANKPENADKPYFLILDEMNLSHVERYFADFLSAMESGEAIPLHANDKNLEEVPPRIFLPANVFIIGTVNIDETTYMFSPKVLDRANAIEFRVTLDEMSAYFAEPAKVDFDLLVHRGANMATDFLRVAKSTGSGYSDAAKLSSTMLDFFRELKKVGAEFGYRTASEINRFAETVKTINPDWSTDEIVDAAVMQKLLPKIHGSRRKIEASLKALATLCVVRSEDAVAVLNNSEEFNFDDTSKVKFPLSLEKIYRMHKAVVQDGFTSFAEA
ncbi:McrB family protein [Botryobacter ruber]|uniref:McrB family protein n=1 Tax=Botryobacter ruber TaxID=2171629 RepID=UPI001F0BD596|nr:DUF3578 domain-containing protein [Botryobacter ruber]